MNLFTFLLTFLLCKMTTQTNQLIEDYAPIVYFNREEKYLPLDMNIVLQNSTLKNFTTNQIITTPTNRELYDFAKSNDFKPINDGSVVLSIDKSLYNHSYLLQDQPIYAIIREKDNNTYITYIIFFPFNGDYTILRHGRAGSHPGDLEHYTVELDKDKKLSRVHFSAHGYKDGRWVSKDKLQFEHGRIVVFSALNGHGLYHKDGMTFRIGGLANDYLERGARWNPKVFEIFARTSPKFDIDTMGWTVYNGRIGGSLDKPNTEGIMGLEDKNWYGSDATMFDELDESFYKPPPIINSKITKPLFFLSHSVMVALIYIFVFLLLIYIDKHILLFSNNPFLKSLMAIMILKLSYKMIPNDDNVYHKHIVALAILLAIIYFFNISEREIRERL
jgi:hypothetical protein